MDYKALRQRASAFAHVVEDCGLGAVPFDVDGINIVALPTSDIFALCDAVEALEKDRERLDFIEASELVFSYEESEQVDGSEVGFWMASYAHLDQSNAVGFGKDIRAVIDRVRDDQAPTASTPAPAEPSDA